MSCTTYTDSSCVNKKNNANIKIKQNNADIASYLNAIADIDNAIKTICDCTQDLDCIYNNITSAVNDASASQQFDKISSYSDTLSNTSNSLAEQKTNMNSQIELLKADNIKQQEIVKNCGNCLKTECSANTN